MLTQEGAQPCPAQGTSQAACPQLSATHSLQVLAKAGVEYVLSEPTVDGQREAEDSPAAVQLCLPRSSASSGRGLARTLGQADTFPHPCLDGGAGSRWAEQAHGPEARAPRS